MKKIQIPASLVLTFLIRCDETSRKQLVSPKMLQRCIGVTFRRKVAAGFSFGVMQTTTTTTTATTQMTAITITTTTTMPSRMTAMTTSPPPTTTAEKEATTLTKTTKNKYVATKNSKGLYFSQKNQRWKRHKTTQNEMKCFQKKKKRKI